MGSAQSIHAANIIGVKQVAVVCATILVATLSFRDVVFCILGAVSIIGLIMVIQRQKLEQKNSKSRVVIHFDEVKKDFARQMEKFETIYAKENFFINNYSKGLYHHVTFEEQLDIIKWVEKVEKKLQDESLKQFDDFEKSLNQIDDRGVSKVTQLTESTFEVTAEPGLTSEMSLRDSTNEMELINNINIRQVDEKKLKEILSEIKQVLADFYKKNEVSYKQWAELNNQTMDFLRKIFSTSNTESSKQYHMFSLSVDKILENSPSLILEDSPFSKFLGGNDKARASVRGLFNYDWDTLRIKITGENTSLIERNNEEGKVISFKPELCRGL